MFVSFTSSPRSLAGEIPYLPTEIMCPITQKGKKNAFETQFLCPFLRVPIYNCVYVYRCLARGGMILLQILSVGFFF